MTKTIKRILLLCLVAALLGTVALAADMDCTALNDATLSVTEGAYTAALSGADGGANGYALLVISVDKELAAQIKAGTATDGWTISDETIQYIDQGDNASFTFKPMANKTSVVLLGGANTSPIILGVLESKFILGDVDNNGEVEDVDRTVLARFLAEWDGYGERIPVKEAADVDKNGEVEDVDRTILARYLAEWGGVYDGYGIGN